MRRLLQSTGWLLLAPEPEEKDRNWGLALLFLLVGGFNVVAGVYDIFVDGVFNGGIASLFLGPIFVGWAALYAPPARRCRVVLGVRAALTLAYLAFASSFLWFPQTFGGYPDRVWVWTIVTLVFVPGIFCVNYFTNRYRARRSRSA